MKYTLCYVSDAVVWPARDGFHAEANWPFYELAGELTSCAEFVVLGRTVAEPHPAAAQFVPLRSGSTPIRAVGFPVKRRGPLGYATSSSVATELLRREYAQADVLYLKPSVSAVLGQRFMTPRHRVVTHLMGNPADTAGRGSLAGALAKPFVARMTRSLFRRATLPVSVSFALAKEVDPACERCLVVNESRLRHEHIVAPASGRPYAIGYVGRLSPEKGTDLLPEILRHLPDGRLLVLGGGPAEGALRSALAREGLLERVDFAAPVAWGSDLFEWMDQIDVLLVPSYSEGCGLAPIEALARGGKVAAAHVGGLVENLEGVGRARLVPSRNAADWLAAIRELRESNEPQPDIRPFLFDENMKQLAIEIERRFRRADAA
jgi:glycosyltransferase involved in cell wall biosynthesis